MKKIVSTLLSFIIVLVILIGNTNYLQPNHDSSNVTINSLIKTALSETEDDDDEGGSSSCFVRTITDCPNLPFGTGGGERLTCDFSGTFKAGETCTPVSCTTGAGDPLVCQKLS